LSLPIDIYSHEDNNLNEMAMISMGVEPMTYLRVTRLVV